MIPTFDRPHCLAEAIGSVLAQDTADFEIIVGDDGDKGARVVDAAGDPRVRYQPNPSRLGIARNWEALIASAKGDYLLLLMDDDRLETGFLTRCLEVFGRDPELGVVFTNHTIANGGAVTVRRCHLQAGRHDRFATAFLQQRPVAISAALWRASAWQVIRPLPDTGAADMVLFAKLAEAGYPFYYLDEPLMCYRVHASNYSSTQRFRQDRVRAWRELSFNDPAAQRERDSLLAEALRSRAAGAIQDGNLAAARVDIAEARQLDRRLSLYELGISLAASHESMARVARAVARLKVSAQRDQRSRRLSHESVRQRPD